MARISGCSPSPDSQLEQLPDFRHSGVKKQLISITSTSQKGVLVVHNVENKLKESFGVRFVNATFIASNTLCLGMATAGANAWNPAHMQLDRQLPGWSTMMRKRLA